MAKIPMGYQGYGFLLVELIIATIEYVVRS
jgi:hypothetical protein